MAHRSKESCVTSVMLSPACARPLRHCRTETRRGTTSPAVGPRHRRYFAPSPLVVPLPPPPVVPIARFLLCLGLCCFHRFSFLCPTLAPTSPRCASGVLASAPRATRARPLSPCCDNWREPAALLLSARLPTTALPTSMASTMASMSTRAASGRARRTGRAWPCGWAAACVRQFQAVQQERRQAQLVAGEKEGKE